MEFPDGLDELRFRDNDAQYRVRSCPAATLRGGGKSRKRVPAARVREFRENARFVKHPGPFLPGPRRARQREIQSDGPVCRRTSYAPPRLEYEPGVTPQSLQPHLARSNPRPAPLQFPLPVPGSEEL